MYMYKRMFGRRPDRECWAPWAWQRPCNLGARAPLPSPALRIAMGSRHHRDDDHVAHRSQRCAGQKPPRAKKVAHTKLTRECPMQVRHAATSKAATWPHSPA